jgi:hypothetical protein
VEDAAGVEGDTAQPAEAPITALISAAATIHRSLLLGSFMTVLLD